MSRLFGSWIKADQSPDCTEGMVTVLAVADHAGDLPRGGYRLGSAVDPVSRLRRAPVVGERVLALGDGSYLRPEVSS